MPTPSMVTAIASIGLLLLGIVTLLWNKLDRRFDAVDKRFDDLKADVNRQFDRQDKRFDDLTALIQEALKART